MSRTKADWEAKVHREVPSATVRPNGVTFTCRCGATGDVNFVRNRLPPVVVRKKIVQQGWRLTSKAAICPACQHEEAEPMPQNKPEPETVTALPSVNQTPDARKVHRAVMGWLEEAYDETARRYRDGFSDQSIADETGASVRYVAKCREDYFGPLAVPSELENLHKALKALDDKLRESDAQLHRAVKLINDTHVNAMKAIQTEQQAIREKIEKLVIANGWHQ